MMKYKALYQGLYDDLKDADMMIGYACGIKEENPEDLALADEIAKYAKMRLEHFNVFQKLFETEMMNDRKTKDYSICNCLWDQTWSHMLDWHECIQKKIDKY